MYLRTGFGSGRTAISFRWSYDVEEVERYREEQAVIRAQKLARNKMLKDIMAHYEAMSDDELRACLEDLDR